jgi:hypothetical protein
MEMKKCWKCWMGRRRLSAKCQAQNLSRIRMIGLCINKHEGEKDREKSLGPYFQP